MSSPLFPLYSIFFIGKFFLSCSTSLFSHIITFISFPIHKLLSKYINTASMKLEEENKNFYEKMREKIYRKIIVSCNNTQKKVY
jgi:hypothetical protein